MQDEAVTHAEAADAACQTARPQEGSALAQDVQLAAHELAIRAYLTKGDDSRALVVANDVRL